jgi:hypothetical protein
MYKNDGGQAGDRVQTVGGGISLIHCKTRSVEAKSMAVEEGVGDYTQDGTVDLKGNPVRRSKRGGWTACSFIVGNYLSASFISFSIYLKLSKASNPALRIWLPTTNPLRVS